MAQAPRRNLPSGSQQWGRFVEDRVKANVRGLSNLRNDLDIILNNTSSNLSLVAQHQQTILAQQQTLFDLADTQVDVVQGANTNYGASATNTSYQNKTHVTLTLPGWANQAVVFGAVFGYFIWDTNQIGDDSQLVARVGVGNASGGETSNSAGYANNTAFTNLATTWSTLVTLPASKQVTVYCQVHSENSKWYPYSSNSRASVSAIALGIR